MQFIIQYYSVPEAQQSVPVAQDGTGSSVVGTGSSVSVPVTQYSNPAIRGQGHQDAYESSPLLGEYIFRFKLEHTWWIVYE